MDEFASGSQNVFFCHLEPVLKVAGLVSGWAGFQPPGAFVDGSTPETPQNPPARATPKGKLS